jgi:hypothetical protein
MTQLEKAQHAAKARRGRWQMVTRGVASLPLGTPVELAVIFEVSA